MKIKKLIKILCCVTALVVFTCGCAFSPSNPEYLLSAPKLTGEMQPVQEALEEKIEEKYQLKNSAGSTTVPLQLTEKCRWSPMALSKRAVAPTVPSF